MPAPGKGHWARNTVRMVQYFSREPRCFGVQHRKYDTTRALIAALLVVMTGDFSASAVTPYEKSVTCSPAGDIDRLVFARLEQKGIQRAGLCSDEVFIRRVYIDAIGTFPTPEETREFLKDSQSDKRLTLIKELLYRDEFADYWSMKWCDLLRVKAEFPIKLWPNAVQAYHRWIHDAIKQNNPYDQFVRELLTSSGSNFRTPPVNFYRAVQGREPSALAGAVALTFMGVRFDKLPQSRQDGMSAFFSKIAYKGTAEWKEEVIYLDPGKIGSLDAVFPDGSHVRIPGGEDPRQHFADWLIAKDNPWFARNIVNRVWYWLMGRGIIHEPDDIRDNNPPVHPELLTLLERELVSSNFDLKYIYRLILSSHTYQQSSIPQSKHPEAEALFAHYIVRQLEAEVLIDALCWLSDTQESYSSPIPEPFTYVPEEHRTIQLADGSITSPFLEMFGRPPRDTGMLSERSSIPTHKQRLHMLNSSHIQRKIERGRAMNRLVRMAKGNNEALVKSMYLTILTRHPTEAELKTALAYFREGGVNTQQAGADVAWALINSKEFLYRH